MPEVGNQFCVITISRDIRPNILIEKTGLRNDSLKSWLKSKRSNFWKIVYRSKIIVKSMEI